MKKLIVTVLTVLILSSVKAYTLKGVVLNTTNDSVVSEAIILMLQNNKVVASATANFMGEFKISVKKGKEYKMEVVKDGFKTESATLLIDQDFIEVVPFVTVYLHPLTLNPTFNEMQEGMVDKELNPDIMEDIGDLSALPEGYKIIEAKPLKIDDKKTTNFNVNLDKSKEKTNVNVEVLKETFNKESLENVMTSDKEKFPSSYYIDGDIYYGAGKALLTADVKGTLNKLASKLLNEPNTKLRIVAFADGLQEAKIGDFIGKFRAEEITKYMISKGVEFDRLIVSVVGNTSLSNGCTEGVECEEFQHQENRKVELSFVEE